MGRSAIRYVLWAAALCCSCGEAEAQTAATPPGWTFDLGFYGWMTATSGSLDVRGREASIDQSFLDTLNKADTLLGLMGHAEAHHDDLGGILDFVYAKIGFKRTAVGPLSAKPTSTMAIVDFVGAYRFGRWWLDNTGARAWARRRQLLERLPAATRRSQRAAAADAIRRQRWRQYEHSPLEAHATIKAE